MDLTVFDFRDNFTLHEIASLCLGRDPGLSAPAGDDPARTPYREIRKAAEASADMANAECAGAHFEGRARPSLYPRLMYPKWALQRIPCANGEPAWTEIEKDSWPEQGFDPNDRERWEFDRQTIANWLSGRDFRPAYDFSRRGGLIVHTEVGLVTSPHPRAETTHLNIIGAMLELMLSKSEAGRAHSIFNSQAAIIDALTLRNPNTDGISKTTLEAKFAEARRRLYSK